MKAKKLDRTYSRWSVGAIECFNRHCICDGCFMQDFLNGKCRMKQSVIKMVAYIGIPSNAKKFNPILEEKE